MGKITGFLEYERLEEAYEAPRGAQEALPRVHPAPDGRGCEDPGRALHGLRHPVLHERLPGQQHHSRLERPRLPAGLEARDRDAALDQQLPGIHRPHLPGAVRGSVRAAHQRGRRSASSRSSTRSSTRPGNRAGSSRSPPRTGPARRSRSSARVPRASPARSSSRAPVTRSSCSRRTTASAGCCATAFPISRWKSG